MSETTCPACNLPLPTEPLDITAVLAREPQGASTRRIAKALGRREASVRAELEAALKADKIERLPAAGQSHAQRWRLRPASEEASGVAQAQPHTIESAGQARSAETGPADTSAPSSATTAQGDRVEMFALTLLVILALALGTTCTLFVLNRGRS